MTRPLRLLICIGTGLVLCQCESTETKKSKSSELGLAQRAQAKPDLGKRSSFEKYLSSAQSPKGGAGSQFQKQMHHSKEFSGVNSASNQKQFKTKQSWFGRSKNTGADQTYSLGSKKAAEGSESFKAGTSRYGNMQAREGSSEFSGANNRFSTGQALRKDQRIARDPMIIESIETTSMKKGAYTEDEVKRLLGR